MASQSWAGLWQPTGGPYHQGRGADITGRRAASQGPSRSAKLKRLASKRRDQARGLPAGQRGG
eukprot:4160590-Alexandrium_andersonii.AAC.1